MLSKSTIFLLSFLLFTVGLEAGSLLYKASSDQSTVYILGSIHLAKPEFYPLDKAIERAYEQSDVLVVELDPDTAKAAQVMQTTMQRLGTYPQGKSLKSELSAETYRALQAYTARAGVPLDALQRLRPWVVMLQLSVTEMLRLGYAPEFGIDRHFLEKAKREHKRVMELETVEEQMALLSRDDSDYQDRLLRYSLASMEEIEPMLEQLSVSWQNGDAKSMEKMFLLSLQDDPDLKGVYDDLVTRRNHRMTEKILSFLKTDRNYFVVVGAGHVIGKEGIAALLAKEGYKITQK